MPKFSLGRGDAGNIDVGASNSSSQPPRTKRLRTGLPLTAPSTTVTTSAANVSVVTVQENDTIEALFLGEDEDMEFIQSEGEEESGSEEERSGDGEGEEEEEEEEEVEEYEEEEGEYQTDQEDEGSEELDDNLGLANSDADMVSNDVGSGNTAGPLGTKSSILGIFTDPDVLDCPICYDTLTIPVFQCENGHHACSSCCTKIGNKCPCCSCPIGYIRCRPIERILNSVKFSCRNLDYGCNDTILYCEMEGHEKTCIFAPCSCPIESCDYVGSQKNLYVHFREKHLSSAAQFQFKRPFRFWLEHKHKRVILQEKTDGTIFVLNNSNNHPPQAINLIRIGSLHSQEEFCYKLSIGHGDSTLKLKSVSATMPKWSTSQPLRKYLLVPADYVFSGGSVSLTVCIEKREVSQLKQR